MGTFSVGDTGARSLPCDRSTTTPSGGGDWELCAVLAANP